MGKFPPSMWPAMGDNSKRKSVSANITIIPLILAGGLSGNAYPKP